MPNKKRIILSFSIILFVTVFMLIICYTKRDQLSFNHFVKKFTTDTLSENALDLHYTVKKPSNYGIYDVTPLPVYEKADALSTYKDFEEQLCTLESIDVSALTCEDAFAYYVLHDYLEENLELEKYPYYAEPLTPNSGVHTTLPILLAEYTFYDKQDIENYFELLSAIPAYFEGIALYETEKAAEGLFMNSIALDKVVTACEEFVSSDDLSSHLLTVSFDERIQKLAASDKTISAEDMIKYQKKNQLLLQNYVFSAYLSLAQKLTDLSDYCNENYTGLHSFEQGKDYYLSLLKRSTGSYRQIADIKEMLYASFEESYINLVNILSKNQSLLENDCFTEFDTHFPISDAEELLTHLQSAMQEDFPALSAPISVDIKTVSASLEDYCSPAFYLTVPVDAYKENVIYLNPKNSLTGLNLYTTLAHEGFPGHLYQTVYFHLANADAKDNDTGVVDSLTLLRNTLYYGGYVEGYALYVEALSYDYASQLCTHANLPNAKTICDTLKYEWQMQISLYCLLDIAIHYDGASYEQIAAILYKFGIVDETSIKTVYQYLLEEPTTYLKYYLGYLEINNLKNLAKGLWVDEYSERKFHTFLLETGPCSFIRLEQKLMEE